jgi:putative glutamine amidotransferase
MQTIVTHTGTGTDIVDFTLRQLGADLKVIATLPKARAVDFDGLILLGGADIMPFWYGEEMRHTNHVNKERDLIEWTLARRALADGKPIFGICRGHQMLAVAAGGALYQDIWADGASESHFSDRHELTGVAGVLDKRLPTSWVNSLHHQAVRTLPPGFLVAAQTEDGIVEAIYRPGMLGVQWHPELMIRSNRQWASLFQWFLEGLQP